MTISTNEALVGDVKSSIVCGLSQYVAYVKEQIQDSDPVSGSGVHDSGDSRVTQVLQTWSDVINSDANKVSSAHLLLSEADAKVKANLLGISG